MQIIIISIFIILTISLIIIKTALILALLPGKTFSKRKKRENLSQNILLN